MATLAGLILAPAQSSSFAPSMVIAPANQGGAVLVLARFRVTASGQFMETAVLTRSVDNGATWQTVPNQGPPRRGGGGPLFTGNNGTGLGSATLEVNDSTAGVLYAVAGVATGAWAGELDFTFTNVALATVTVAPGRSLIANGST